MQLYGNVIIELTRWCNKTCSHCLRGSRQRIKQTRANMYTFLSNFDGIDMVTFTGGEPTLVPELIGEFIDICRVRDIRVGSYYIATNAHRITKEFLNMWERLHHWCDDNEVSAIDISNDKFHEENKHAYKLLDFAEYHGFNCNFKYNKRMFEPDYHNCISEGRAKDWSTRSVEKTPFMIRTEKERGIIGYIEGELYLNCKGNIIHGCDWSFKNQDKPENIISHVSTFEPEMLYKYGKEEEDYEYKEKETIEQLQQDCNS